ncbi:tyrosine-type recombinase/integrase [Sphingomonas baiyangensis]|uniref:tyrosine-type recombinase/integrase n=1 Tax=Sphingomonas baiyangensis TaxID=2572576 RepID=UPI00146CEF9D|nr:site-specific integrase [Sphingomonas baiyangensis]
MTKRAVDDASSGATDTFLWDTELKGFGLKVTPKGAKSYVLQYRLGGRRTPTRRYTIGTHGSPWTPDTARRRAHELLTDVRRGIDPINNERDRAVEQAELNFRSYVTQFIERYARREQPRSWHQAERTLITYAVPAFSAKALPQISRRDISRLVELIAEDKEATARYLHACLRKLFRWAVARGDILHSPMSEMPAPAPIAARDRVLSDSELAAIWRAAVKLGFPFGTSFRLLIATGQRREEVGGIAWDEIDWEGATWTIPAARAKNGLGHVVPLSPIAMQELAGLDRGTSGLILSTTGRTPPSGWSKVKRRLDKLVAEELGVSEIKAWRTHDIRRTVATGLQRLGVRFEVTEAILNHVSGARAGVAGIYQRYNWAVEKRVALEAWGDALQRCVDGNGIPATGSTALGIQAIGQ